MDRRNKRALIVLGVAVAIAALLLSINSTEASAPLVNPAAALPAAQKRLDRVRQLAATVPGKERTLKIAMGELAQREKGLIPGETAAQAQAQLLQIVRRVARAQAPPLDVRGSDFLQPKPFGKDYGEVALVVSFEARIDQLVNLLADITAQPELIATSEMRFSAASGREKIVPVRLTISGIVPRRLVPEKKGLGAF